MMDFKMKTVLFFALGVTLLCTGCGHDDTPQNRAEAIVAEMNNPDSRNVLVISHRGDWRNWPENSLPAIESAIEQDVDIVEIDIHLTVDSVLVLCHDTTIDRTTTGKGKISGMTYDSLATVFLKTGHGRPTKWKIPTLREALELCRDRVVVNIDKGYDYYDEVLSLTEELGVTGQVLIKGKKTVAEVEEKFAMHENNLLYMPVIDFSKPYSRGLLEDYFRSGVVPMAFEVCWDEMTPEIGEYLKAIMETDTRLWVNSLWPSLCGGLDDDAALLGSPDEIYGKLLDLGVTMIQTDRAELLIGYLRNKGLHD